MGELTRLGFVKSSAAAAAGLTAVGGLIGTQAAEAHEEQGAVGSEPVVAYLKDPSAGEISVLSGNREVIVRDRALAARIARAAR